MFWLKTRVNTSKTIESRTHVQGGDAGRTSPSSFCMSPLLYVLLSICFCSVSLPLKPPWSPRGEQGK